MAEETEAGHAVVVQNGEAVAVGAGHETLGAEVLEHAEVAMPQLDLAIYPNLIFWLVVSLVAIYMILTRVALPRVGAILAERNDAISNDLEQAALYKRRATEAEAAYNAALAKAREESQKIAAEAKAAVGKELAVVMAKADAEIAAKAAESEARIREIEASAAQSVAEVAKSTAEAIVAALGPRAIDSAAIDAAVTARLGG
jgi:F-type H+-transporting ATPase subunit b